MWKEKYHWNTNTQWKNNYFYLWYPYICIHILWNILTFTILYIVNTNIPKSIYIVIYVQDNRTTSKLFLLSYVTLSLPGTAQLIHMAYFIRWCPPPYPELKCIRIPANMKWNNHSLFSLKCALTYIWKNIWQSIVLPADKAVQISLLL